MSESVAGNATEEERAVVSGRVFDTPYERGCVALEEPDVDGNFRARDSDGVVCEFHVAMVTS